MSDWKKPPPPSPGEKTDCTCSTPVSSPDGFCAVCGKKIRSKPPYNPPPSIPATVKPATHAQAPIPTPIKAETTKPVELTYSNPLEQVFLAKYEALGMAKTKPQHKPIPVQVAPAQPASNAGALPSQEPDVLNFASPLAQGTPPASNMSPSMSSPAAMPPTSSQIPSPLNLGSPMTQINLPPSSPPPGISSPIAMPPPPSQIPDLVNLGSPMTQTNPPPSSPAPGTSSVPSITHPATTPVAMPPPPSAFSLPIELSQGTLPQVSKPPEEELNLEFDITKIEETIPEEVKREISFEASVKKFIDVITTKNKILPYEFADLLGIPDKIEEFYDFLENNVNKELMHIENDVVKINKPKLMGSMMMSDNALIQELQKEYRTWFKKYF
ncbi:MAG: hypothetical protein ACFFCS_03280 [Candidatus Hodarchaeota archaeon]